MELSPAVTMQSRKNFSVCAALPEGPQAEEETDSCDRAEGDEEQDGDRILQVILFQGGPLRHRERHLPRH